MKQSNLIWVKTGKRIAMAEQLNKAETVDLVEALKMEMIINQALMDLLISKGIITEEEMMAKIKAVKESMGYKGTTK